MLVGFGPITTLQLLGLIQSRRSGGSSGAEMSNVGLVAGVIAKDGKPTCGKSGQPQFFGQHPG
jgi:hypothetical protein